MIEGIAALIRILKITSQLYIYIVIASVLMSWFRPDEGNPIVRFIRGMTEPPMALLRRFMPFLQAGMIDFTPIALILLLELVTTLLVRVLERIAFQYA